MPAKLFLIETQLGEDARPVLATAAVRLAAEHHRSRALWLTAHRANCQDARRTFLTAVNGPVWMPQFTDFRSFAEKYLRLFDPKSPALPPWDRGLARYDSRQSDTATPPLDLAELASEKWPEPNSPLVPRYHAIILDGLTRFSVGQTRLLKKLSQHVQEIWWAAPEWDPKKVDELFPEVGHIQHREKVAALPIRQPNGLSHLLRNLFQSSTPVTSDDSSGVERIQAPESLGEARLVAKQVRQKILNGSRPERIVVAARRWDSLIEIFRDVFRDTDIPLSCSQPLPLSRHPAARFLRTAWLMPDEGFPFASVAAILRSNWFRPYWREFQQKPELAGLTEDLLRELGEPKGRDAYLQAVKRWVLNPPERLEDQLEHDPQRARLIQRVGDCSPYLNKFFSLWDEIPERADRPTFARHFLKLAHELGTPTAANHLNDPFWQRLEAELNRSASRELGPWQPGQTVSRSEFFRHIEEWARLLPLPEPTSSHASVRLLNAEEAAQADCDWLFLVNLREGEFPLPGPKGAVTDHDSRAAALDRERALFRRLLSRPRYGIILSHPAVKRDGQPILASSFLDDAIAHFPPDTVPTVSQKMLIEGYAQGPPQSRAEHRLQVAKLLAAETEQSSRFRSVEGLPDELIARLRRARAMARARFATEHYGHFDGLIGNDGPLQKHLMERFGPENALSPTALESYIFCPFQFWLRHLLRVDSLGDPLGEVEQSRRGSAIHRALARYHQTVKAPPESSESLMDCFRLVVEEEQHRAAGQLARKLWQLEYDRFQRLADRYLRHWRKFLESNDELMPTHFEAEFGSSRGASDRPPFTIEHNGERLSLRGVIDRIDSDGNNFWVIDYKTGRKPPTATEIEKFQKVQLPLYAMAAEQLLFDNGLSPSGMAYWLFNKTGPTRFPKKHSKNYRWEDYRETLVGWTIGLAKAIRSGQFILAPRDEKCTALCKFGPVCRIGQSRRLHKEGRMPLPVVNNDDGEES